VRFNFLLLLQSGMKRSIEEHAARFDEKAAEYDESKSEEYRACASLVVEHGDPRAR